MVALVRGQNSDLVRSFNSHLPLPASSSRKTCISSFPNHCVIMRPTTSYLLGLLGAATVAFARNTELVESNTVSLTKDTFHDFIEAHDLVLVNFYSPSCKHCQKLAPKYEEAARELKENNVPLVKVNCMEDLEFCRDMDIQYWPKMEVFRGLESREPYRGDRTTESIVAYMIDEFMTDGSGEGLYYQASA